MSNPSYVPRMFAKEPQTFGLLHELDWLPTEPATLVVATASRIQHAQSYAIWSAIKNRHGSVAAFVRASGGQVTDQFRRALRGQAVLQPRDLAYAALHFGQDLRLPDPVEVLAGRVVP